MKQIIPAALIIFASIFVLPLILVNGQPLLGADATESAPGEQSTATESHLPSISPAVTNEPPTAAPSGGSHDKSVMLTVQIAGQERQMSLYDYLLGVLLGEMPSNFPAEAIKAQAVAVRSLVMRDTKAVYCDDPSCCMAYIEPGTDYPEIFLEAAESTDGQVVEYEGQPILAVFFSTSSGKTESSADVWGGDFPYLRPVDSPGEQDAPQYSGSVSVLASEFWETVRGNYPDAQVGDSPFGAITRSDSGGVINAEIGGVVIPGGDIRAMFGLNSTNFSVSVREGSIIFETLGFGHGVGLSQYGARAMALEGSDYHEILSKYYPGTSISE